jgi:hypothetical protein
MNSMNKILCSTLLLLIAPSGFACDYPSRVSIPVGATATKEEMLVGQKAVKEFVASMETYLDCILAEEKQARSEMDDIEPEDEQLREDMLNKKYNAAVDDMERIAANFNTAVQDYRSRDE